MMLAAADRAVCKSQLRFVALVRPRPLRRNTFTGANDTDVGRNWTYAYDGLGRLKTAIGPRSDAGGRFDNSFYAYDPADNMVNNSAVCGDEAVPAPQMTYGVQGVASGQPHAPKVICGSAVAYDGNGDTTSRWFRRGLSLRYQTGQCWSNPQKTLLRAITLTAAFRRPVFRCGSCVTPVRGCGWR